MVSPQERSGCRWILRGALPALDRVHEQPRLYPMHLYGTQRAVLDRYPFSIVYRELLHEIQIVAVAHAKRRPGYWTHRL